MSKHTQECSRFGYTERGVDGGRAKCYAREALVAQEEALGEQVFISTDTKWEIKEWKIQNRNSHLRTL